MGFNSHSHSFFQPYLSFEVSHPLSTESHILHHHVQYFDQLWKIVLLSRLFVMSFEDDTDLFLSTREDAFESIDGSNTSSESDQETLVEIQVRKHSEAASKMQSGNRVSKAVKPPRKKKACKKKSDAVSAHSCLVLFGVEELLLVACAFMKVSNTATHSTDKKAEKFWDEVYITFEEFVTTENKMNESNPDFSPIEPGRGTELIRNC